MKNFILGLFATLLFAFNANAQKTTQSETQVKTTVKEENFAKIISNGKEITTLTFKNAKDLNAGMDSFYGVMDEVIKSTDNGGECTMTVTISVTVSVGVISTTLSTTVTAPCSQIKAAVVKAQKALWDSAMAIVGK